VQCDLNLTNARHLVVEAVARVVRAHTDKHVTNDYTHTEQLSYSVLALCFIASRVLTLDVARSRGTKLSRDTPHAHDLDTSEATRTHY